MPKESGESGRGKKKSGRKKLFVLDTNVLIHDPGVLETFEENDVVIPIMVIEELDSLKSGVGVVPYSSRKALRSIGKYLKRGAISKGVPLPGGGTLRVDVGEKNYFTEMKPDNFIISCAINLQEKGAENVVVISKDTGVRIKTESMGVRAQDYERDKTSIFQSYGRILAEEDYCNGIQSVRYQKRGAEIFRIWENDCSCQIRNHRDLFGISAKNVEQVCAMDALTSPNIHVIALTGKPGAGKTLLGLAAALYQVTKEDSLYEKVIVARPPVPMGYEMGFLPGDISEKINPWMRPIYDNLEFLVKTPKDLSSGKKQRGKVYKGWQYLFEKDYLEIEALTYMRGRSLPGRYIIIDEAQNLRPLDVKTLVTRMGENSKIVFTGDLDQIDTPYLDAESNGLAYLIAKLINEPDFCYLSMQKSARSELADRMAELL